MRHMNWICELTCSQWMYIIVKVTSIVGLFYAAVASMISGNKGIMMKSYNVLPEMKVYEFQKKNIILNVPVDIITENLKEDTSSFIGFLVTAFGLFLDIIVDTQKMEWDKALILALPISALVYAILWGLTKLITTVRCSCILDKIEGNQLFPNSYIVRETDNVNCTNETIQSKLYTKDCSWERMVINGEVEDKFTTGKKKNRSKHKGEQSHEHHFIIRR